MSHPKNPSAVKLGRLGGKARSEAKTLAARRNARQRFKNKPGPEGKGSPSPSPA